MCSHRKWLFPRNSKEIDEYRSAGSAGGVQWGKGTRKAAQTLWGIIEATNIWIFDQYAHGPDPPGGTRHYDLGQELVTWGYRLRYSKGLRKHIQGEEG